MEPRVIARQDSRLEVELHADHPLRLHGASGRKIEALSGTIWITAYGELTDFELAPGQSFVVPNDRLTLVEPIGCGTVRIEQPPSVASALMRLLNWLPRRRSTGKHDTAACLPASRC